jgi:hypothetical protein
MFESLPPQPTSPSLTRTKADRARNAAISRYFPHLVWSPCLKSNHGSRILVPCLRGPYFGVSFYAARHARVTCLKPAVLIIVRLARRELAWINVTAHATAEWIAQQIVVNLFAGVSQLFWFAVGTGPKADVHSSAPVPCTRMSAERGKPNGELN